MIRKLFELFFGKKETKKNEKHQEILLIKENTEEVKKETQNHYNDLVDAIENMDKTPVETPKMKAEPKRKYGKKKSND